MTPETAFAHFGDGPWAGELRVLENAGPFVTLVTAESTPDGYRKTGLIVYRRLSFHPSGWWCYHVDPVPLVVNAQ